MEQGRFRIVGGTDSEPPGATVPTADDVLREARRRLSTGDIDPYRVRALATGRAVPNAVRYRMMQIEFVANTLCALRPIPADFADDRYWPAG